MQQNTKRRAVAIGTLAICLLSSPVIADGPEGLESLKERLLPSGVSVGVVGFEVAQVADATSAKLIRFYTRASEGAPGTCVRTSYVVADVAHPAGAARYDQVAESRGACPQQISGFGQVQPIGASAKDASLALAAIIRAASSGQEVRDRDYPVACHEVAVCGAKSRASLKAVNLQKLRLLERSVDGIWRLSFATSNAGNPTSIRVSCIKQPCLIDILDTAAAPF